jgi:hypothetical protein
MDRAGMKGPVFGLSQQPGEAGGSLIPGARVKGGSSPDEGEAGRYHRTAQCLLSETERCNESEPVVEPAQE